MLRLNNRNLFLNMIKTDILKPILELTVQESKRDNLLSSSCQEFFEYIRRENVKELIAHCMSKHGDKIRLLAASSLGGPRFQAFIQRHEINIEPPPKEEEKMVEKPIANGARRWGQGRLMEVEEEDYFNADDDDDDEIVPVLTAAQTFPRAAAAGALPLKRKRPRSSSLTQQQQQQRPSKSSLVGAVTSVRTAPPSTPPLGGLVDYGDDDDATGPSPVEGTAPSSPKSPMPPGLVSPGMPPSPRLSHRQIPFKPPMIVPSSIPEDEEDNLLESLLSKGGPPSPSLLNTRPPQELAPGLKRRREEDDDELLALANKSKRQSIGLGVGGKDKPSPGAGAGLGSGGLVLGEKTVATLVKGAEEGPKKIKLKLASSVAATPAPSSTGAKDGDTG